MPQPKSHSSFNANLGGGFPTSGIGRSAKNQEEKDQEKKYLVIAVICVVAADIVAIAGALYYISKNLRDTFVKRRISCDHQAIGHELNTAEIQVEGRDSSSVRQAMKTIGTMASNIANREYRASLWKSVSVTILSVAGVGAVHALVCSIACACLKEVVVGAVSTDLLAFYSFASASCSAPFVFAVATIGLVGLLVYLASNNVNSRNRYEADAKKGKEAFDALNECLMAQPPIAKPQVMLSASQSRMGQPLVPVAASASQSSHLGEGDTEANTEGEQLVEGQPYVPTSTQPLPSAPERI